MFLISSLKEKLFLLYSQTNYGKFYWLISIYTQYTMYDII